MIVYKAKNIHNGKIYVGKTVRTLSHAKARHIQRAKHAWKYGTFSRFYTAIRKYGVESFTWEIIYHGISDVDIQAAERRLILEFKSMSPEFGYNMTPGGDGGAGKKLSESQILKLSKRFSGTGNPLAGRFGPDHPAFGHRKSEEQRQRISSSQKGRAKSDEHRKAISESRRAIFAAPEKVRERALREAAKATEREVRREAFQRDKAAGLLKGENAGPSKVSDVDRALICKRRSEGEAYSSIARDYPIGLTGVRAICKDWGPQNGIPFAKATAQRSTKLSDAQKMVACERFRDGESYAALAEEFGVSQTTMFSVIRHWGPEHGIPYAKHR